MITPMIHRVLSRNDLAQLVAHIAQLDAVEGRSAGQALEAGRIDEILDSPAALDAVRGNGGVPAALSLALLWYIPIRAALRERGVTDVELADYAATLPVSFISSSATGHVAKGSNGIALWWDSISALPPGTVAQGERAAEVGALALWWAGLFPEWVTRRNGGRGVLRAYATFAGQALLLASQVMSRGAPHTASLFARAADHTAVLREALNDSRRGYLGRGVHTKEHRLERFLSHLRPPRN